MKLYFTLIFVGIILFSYSQERDYYRLSKEIIESPYYNISQELSYIGLFKLSQKYDEEKFNLFSSPLSKEDSINFLNYKQHNAKEYILNEAKRSQIVIINEAHFNSMHRVTTYSLLKDLYDIGYRYFGAETFSHRDTSLNERGYPIMSSGSYTREPVFGEIVRYSLQLGYTLFPYEDTSKVDKGYTMEINEKGDTSYFYDSKYRDEIQAKFIMNILKKDPKAKILLHVGYGHAVEFPKTMMAGFLKEMSGIDPLTIDQTRMAPRYYKENEEYFYRLADVKEPTIFVDSSGKAFTPMFFDVDAAIFHPKTIIRNERPTWFSIDGLKKEVQIKQYIDSLNTPCLIIAYYNNEYLKNGKECVAADIIEINKFEKCPVLYLKPNDYHIVVKTENGIIDEFNINVK